MTYIAKEINMWPTSKGGFKTLEEAIEWAELNLNGKWGVWKEGFIPTNPIYQNQ